MTENVLSCLNFDDFAAVGYEAVEEFEAKSAEKINLFDTLTYNVNKTYKVFIESMDFTVVKVGDKFSLRDNANFGDIHFDKFDNAVDMTERVSIYIDDYYVKDIAERIEDIVSGNLTTVDGIIEAINNASDNEKVRAFFNDNNFDMRMLDLISRHTERKDFSY